MKHRLWFKGAGKVTESGLIAFLELWDGSSEGARAEFFRLWTPHLLAFEVTELARRAGNQLPRGTIIALTALLEGSWEVERE